MQLDEKKENILVIFFLIITFFFYFYNIGDLSGLRQGTEGFYLKIADEMFNNGNFIEPLYNGKYHWSKPPLHFWLPRPLFAIFNESNITLSRLSIAIFTLGFAFIFSLITHKRFKISKLTTFLFFTSSLALFKYGRIFMMEMPLALLSTSSFIIFYEFLKEDNKLSLLVGSFLAGLATLVKGPVSLVMIFGAISIYCAWNFLETRKIPIKKILYIFALSTIFSLPWFLVAYAKHGNDFFNYFFLRENLGKFQSKSYPITSVFQGFFLYSLPWSLYIPFVFSNFKKDMKDDFYKYLFCGILFFFILWTIPNQRSTHYAVPSIPIFLLYAISKLKTLDKNKFFIISSKIHVAYVSLIFLLIFLFLYLSYALSLPNLSMIYAATSVLGCVIYFFLLKKEFNLHLIAITNLVTIGIIWIFLIPSAALPMLPKAAINKIGKSNLSVIVHKPYFIEEALGRDVEISNPSKIKADVLDKGNLGLLHSKVYASLSLSQTTEIIYKWETWRRGIRFQHIKQALEDKNTKVLKDTLVLVRKKSAEK